MHRSIELAGTKNPWRSMSPCFFQNITNIRVSIFQAGIPAFRGYPCDRLNLLFGLRAQAFRSQGKKGKPIGLLDDQIPLLQINMMAATGFGLMNLRANARFFLDLPKRRLFRRFPGFYFSLRQVPAPPAKNP